MEEIPEMEEISELVNEIGWKLQLLEAQLQNYGIENVNIRFPRGFLRKTAVFAERLSFIQNETLKTNITYHFLLSDVYRWILNRFDIGLTAKEMVIKEQICLLGNIIDAIVTDVADRIDPPKKKRGLTVKCPSCHDILTIKGTKKKRGLKASLTVLTENKIISGKLKKDLVWLWGIRNKEHLKTLKEAEYAKYKLADYSKAVSIWEGLEKQLNKAQIEGKL
jgi:hypothetical protein